MVVVFLDFLLLMLLLNITRHFTNVWLHRRLGVEVALHGGPHVVLLRVSRYVLQDRISVGQHANGSTHFDSKARSLRHIEAETVIVH